MPVFVIFSVVLQVICGVHVVRTGQDRYWLFIIIIGSYLGCLVYALAVLLPHTLQSRQGKRTINTIKNKLNPTRHVRALEDQLIIGDTPQTRLKMADKLMELQRYDEALENYQKALTHQVPYEPNVLLKIAHAYFYLKNYDHCLQTLNDLLKHNPGYISPEGHLLNAQALHAKGELNAAETTYASVSEYYPGPQAKLEYAKLLLQLNRSGDARKQLDNILSYARVAPPHYRRFHKECLKQAQQFMKELNQEQS